MSDLTTFKRKEIKYLLNQLQYETLKEKLKEYLVEDKHGKSTICNIYYDTPNFELIRKSIEKPVYKEKLRLRSYGVPREDTKVFLELKKKYKGVVYKRREKLTMKEAEEYLLRTKIPPRDTQIFREIDYTLKFYKNIAPAMYISYDREAYFSKEDSSLRITFDENIRWRTEKLDLKSEIYGQPILKPEEHLMELKAGGAVPVWLTKILDELKIYPTSFSKYKNAYLMHINKNNKYLDAV